MVADRPMLARITHADNTRSWMGLPVRGSASQVFSATPQLEVFPSASGYVADAQVLSPGPNEVLSRRVPPVEVMLPGLYALGPGVDVYVALEQLDRGALPASLGEGFDNISNRMSAWYEKSRFSAAELQSDDIARFAAGGRAARWGCASRWQTGRCNSSSSASWTSRWCQAETRLRLVGA